MHKLGCRVRSLFRTWAKWSKRWWILRSSNELDFMTARDTQSRSMVPLTWMRWPVWSAAILTFVLVLPYIPISLLKRKSRLPGNLQTSIILDNFISSSTLDLKLISFTYYPLSSVKSYAFLGWLFIADNQLWRQVFFGPCTAYQFRLCGPASWPLARTTVLTQQERIAFPMRPHPHAPHPTPNEEHSSLENFQPHKCSLLAACFSIFCCLHPQLLNALLIVPALVFQV